MKKIIITLALLVATNGFTHEVNHNVNNVRLEHMKKPSVRKTIRVPDIMGYKTLKCDFHIHTLFSDGIAWPEYRVTEAWEEGLDAIAISDHIEYRPNKKYVVGDHNASYEVALPKAKEKNILLIKAGEITRDMPPGHLNALFMDDVNKLDVKEPIEAIKAAKKQGAFILWNHPGWKAQQPDTCLWMDMHQELYEQGMMHGIEVFNEMEWYPIVLDWCLDKDLAVIGNSDVHDINAHLYDLEVRHRPMTLVFAEERSLPSLKDAMFDKRTVAYYDDKLAGKSEYLKAIFEASVIWTKKSTDKDKVHLAVQNTSDIPFYMLSKDESKSFKVPANGEITITLPQKMTDFYITNLYVRSQSNLEVSIKLQ